jgi:hypothetical protein
MKNMARIGGVSALINAAAYLVGIGLALTILSPIVDADAAKYMAFLADHETVMLLWYLLIYLVAGVTMIPMTLALHDRLKDGTPALTQIATAFGLVWTVTVISSGMIIVNNMGVITELYANNSAQADVVRSALYAVERGLGGAIELPGGMWILLVSLAAWRSGRLPKALNAIGVAVGTAGIVTVLPMLYDAGNVFGIGAIVWFIGVGIILLRGNAIAEPILPSRGQSLKT